MVYFIERRCPFLILSGMSSVAYVPTNRDFLSLHQSFFFGGTYTTTHVGDATENVQRDGISERKQ